MIDTDAEDDDLLWKALADPSRRRILDLLRLGPRTTGELADILASERALSRFAVMKHLAILGRAGLLVARREGKYRWNHVNAAPIAGIYRRWVSAFGELPATAALALKTFAEGEGREKE